MPHIFISYASEDRPIAQALAEALQREGWTVWWDRKIPVGKSFHEVIEDAIDAARCVVVIWTQTSVESDWVRNEADEGNRRNMLVPVRIGEVRIPLGFRHLQAADLHNWRPGAAHSEYDSLRDSIRAVFGQTQLANGVESERAEQPALKREKPVQSHRQSEVDWGSGAAHASTGEGGGRSAASNGTSTNVSDKRSSRKTAWVGAGIVVAVAIGALITAVDEGMFEEDPVINAGFGDATGQQVLSNFVETPDVDVSTAGNDSRLSLQWRDHAVRFEGELTHSGGMQGQVRASLYDLNTGAQLGNETFPVQLQSPATGQYVISGNVVIPNGDSATPGRHTHPVFIQVQHYPNGQVTAQNCTVQGCFAAAVAENDADY